MPSTVRRSRCGSPATNPHSNPPNPDPSPPEPNPNPNPNQVRQSRELLVEASLTTSKNVKSKNVKWTTACFRIKATPSGALDGGGAHLSVAAQERVRAGMPHKARNLDE